MSVAGSTRSTHGLAFSELRSGETVLFRWRAPEGRGLLTTQRCLLMGHPRPFRRPVLWQVDLERVRSLNVVRLRSHPGAWLGARGGFGGAAISTGTLPPLFCVNVNSVTVYAGYPNRAEDLQRRVDLARTDRMTAVLGRLLPYEASQ